MLPDSESVLGPCESSGGTFIASQLHLLDLDRFHTSSPLGSKCFRHGFIVPVDGIYMYNTACPETSPLIFSLFCYSFVAVGRSEAGGSLLVLTSRSPSLTPSVPECEGVRGSAAARGLSGCIV